MRRVNGPFRHGRKWRLIVIAEDGKQTAVSFDDIDAAAAEAVRLRARCVPGVPGRLTVDRALARYEELLAKRNRPSTVATTMHRLRGVLSTAARRPVAGVTPKDVQAWIDKLSWAFDTKRVSVVELKTFAKWLLTERKIRRNFAEGVKLVGRRKRGKPQLTGDESKKFFVAAMALAGEEPGALASAVALTMGLRASEIADRVVRDLDLGGTVLIVPGGKTENARRRIRVPAPLQRFLRTLAAGKAPDAPLLGVTRYGIGYWTKALCKRAGVPSVPPHGLRGTNATLRNDLGEAPERIAAELGHGSFAVTSGHYVSDSSLAARGLDQVEKLVTGL